MDTITRQPRTRAGLVPRVALLDRLEASSHTEIVVVVAPPGYGKTTLLAQWAEREPRQFGWLTIDHHDNDASVLLRNIAVVIDQLEPLGRPVVLVLDDLHLLRDREGLAMMGRLIDDLPLGSQLAIASRAEPPLPLARLRAEGRVLEIGPEDLALGHQEASELLGNAQLDADPGEVGALLDAVLARLAIHRGDVPRARSALARAEDLRRRLTYALPHLAVQVRLELAHTYLALTDVAAAKRALWEVDNVFRQRPDLGVLRGQAEELRAQLGAMRTGAMGASSLTAAEVRLLRLLGTYYSFREVGGQLHLSQHTVKSQALSIYRKFGVSSRSEAIQYARDLGLHVQ